VLHLKLEQFELDMLAVAFIITQDCFTDNVYTRQELDFIPMRRPCERKTTLN
jgi:hypothetical protein